MAPSWFADIDRHFARLVERLAAAPEGGDALFLAAALASAATRKGHVCLDLREVAGKAAPEDLGAGGEGPPCPPLPEWLPHLRSSRVVGSPGDFTPLVLDGADRLYLHRYWCYESELAKALLARAEIAGELPSRGGDPTRLLDLLFPPPEDGSADLQREAARTVLSRPVTFITGGPGTGKTTTVARILLLLLSGGEGRELDVALAAPTGKAAARMKEAMKEAVEEVRRRVPELFDAEPGLAERLPRDASTLHRLLGTIPGSTEFRHGPDNPLRHDVVIVDEASMIDLPLMAKLAAALPPHARLVLLGDRDQLASVEPGAVFGELCRAGEGNRLSGSVVTLAKSYRFREGGGIGTLASLVREEKADAAAAFLEKGGGGGVAFHPVSPQGFDPRALEEEIVRWYRPYLEAKDVGGAFDAFERFRVLCAFREGPFGVVEVNRRAERALARAELLRPRGEWYRGRPVMVTRNDHRLRLYNGDVGLLFPSSRGEGVSAFFRGDGGAFREVPVSRLPDHESAWALTVHKSQGSEFDRILLLLGGVPPGKDASPILTRELVYTGITRARDDVAVWASPELIRAAVARKVERRSGLADALHRPAVSPPGDGDCR